MPSSLTSPLASQFRITPIQKIALHRLGIETVEDLLYHFPVRYGDTAEARSIDSLKQGDTAAVFGKISGLRAGKGFKSHITMAAGTVEDETGRIDCVWFNQPYVAKMFADDMLVRIEGKVSERRKKKQAEENMENSTGPLGKAISSTSKNEGKTGAAEMARRKLYFSNPKIERVNTLPVGVGDSLFGTGDEQHTLYPIYPESRGISSSWIYHALQKIFKSGLIEGIPEPIPGDILKKYHLPAIKTALVWIHTPRTRDDALSARKRFSFEEIFTIQLGKQQARKRYREQPSFVIETDQAHVNEFVRRFPFKATDAQVRAIETIISDMQKEQAMTRLLEGDVGSGKTAVAAATAYAVIAAKQQIAYMCPTEILAAQHFESFIQYFSYMPIQIALITGSGCRKFPSKVNPRGWTDISRSQLLKWVANGEIAVVIGTHALIQKTVQFKRLAYVIIDEQHRFGTTQRAKLVKKSQSQPDVPSPFCGTLSRNRMVLGVQSIDGLPSEPTISGRSDSPRTSNTDRIAPIPHLLSMTATPIPRTLALTMYGDLDLTLLDELPAGRKPVITELVLPNRREETYEAIRHELAAGRQMYVICPRIDEPDPDKEAAIIAKSVKEEAKRLKESVFPDYEIGVLHSKMSANEKDRIMAEFKAGTIAILCATSVVEVGVNVPNATVIIIEGAERFGLAQLHQLRGRVMRSSDQAYCFAFTETNSARSIERLKALQAAKNGFELAELDLSQRGAGQLSGTKQWGVSDIAMEALQNLKMVEAARTEAVKMIETDTALNGFPILKEKVRVHSQDAHFE